MKRGEKVFIDTNILFYADAYKIDNIFGWIDSLYNKVYIHQMVLNEMLSSNARTKVQKYLDEHNRHLKGTNDLGEIHCLAAALLLGATIICSNDMDIQEIIDDNHLSVASEDELANVKLQQDTLVDFCYYVFHHEVASQTNIRKFIKTFQKEKLPQLDRLLQKNNL